jgi:hypothetical protein
MSQNGNSSMEDENLYTIKRRCPFAVLSMNQLIVRFAPGLRYFRIYQEPAEAHAVRDAPVGRPYLPGDPSNR